MILGFKTHFNGKQSHFVQKILACELPEYKRNFVPKIHTIRKGNRWKSGCKIHMAIHVRSKNYFQFNDGFIRLDTCISTQSINIIRKYSWDIDISKSVKVFIDKQKLSFYEIEKLSKNDGFDSIYDFLHFFDKDFSGQIIHWTDFKY